MTASPVFHEVFKSQSNAEGIPLDLKISDFSKSTMTEVCRFAYSENVHFTQHNMIDILAAATKLKMNYLVEKAINYIGKEGMNENTVFKILEANQKDKNMIINMKCFTYIEKNHQKCFKSSDFLQMSSELLRMLLQACKLSQIVAKEAIALWSAYPDNNDHDLDELVSLISLNDYPDESVKNNKKNDRNDHSDTESVGSQMSSRAGSVAGKNRNKSWRRQDPPNQQQPSYNKQQAQDSYANRKQPFKQGPPKVNSQQFSSFNHQFMSSCLKNLSLQGSHSRKNFQYANLNLFTGPKPIFINEFVFIYDLSIIDKQFKIVISDMSSQRKDLFFNTVDTMDKIDGTLSRYILPRPCQIDAGRKIWISIEFSRPEYRMSLEKYSVSALSTPGGLGLRPTTAGSGQIIGSIGYNDA